MKDTIALELARQLRRAAKFQDNDVILDFSDAEQLLDRLEKLEAVYDVVTNLVESAITQADILENGDIVPTRCAVDPNTFDDLQDALAALEEKE